MPEFLAMVAGHREQLLAPSSRVIGHRPSATWGIENRTTRAARDPRRSVEPGGSSTGLQPRISIRTSRSAAAIGSGLWGIEHRIEPDAAIEGNAYDREHPPHRRLPRDAL